MTRHRITILALVLAGMAGSAAAQTPVDTGWTYQGRLTDSAVPATGTYDMRFSVFLDAAGTIPTGPVLDVPGVSVDNGLFTTHLDFGQQFTGYKNWMMIEVSPANAGTYSALSPLQEITSTPQSLFSQQAVVSQQSVFSQLPWSTDPASGNISFVQDGFSVGSLFPSYVFGVTGPTDSYGLVHTDGTIALATFVGGSTHGGWLGTVSNDPLCFYTNNSTALMTLDTAGAVGIGTAVPQVKLHLYNPASVSQRIETGGGTNAWARTEYKTFDGQWDVGTSQGYQGDMLYFYREGAAAIAFGVQTNGDVQIAGQAHMKSLQIVGGSDLAEPFDVNADAVLPGMVVIIDREHPGELRLTDQPYDTKVAGIVSGANGLAPGMVMQAAGQTHAEGKYPIAMTGRVWCWCDASQGAIQPGDRLTTSTTAGHAMLAQDSARCGGAVIGKAMTGLKEGKGLVLVLVNLQ